MARKTTLSYCVSFQSYFEEEDQKVYLYKEPKVTNLSELCERLKTMYEAKFGQNNVKLIMDSKTVSSQAVETQDHVRGQVWPE